MRPVAAPKVSTQFLHEWITHIDAAEEPELDEKRPFSRGDVLKLEILAPNKFFWAAGVDTLMADANMTFHLRTLSRVKSGNAFALFFDNLVGESDKSFEFLGCGCRRSS
jgi:hypothetical protein